jgi:hypothetical protein
MVLGVVLIGAGLVGQAPTAAAAGPPPAWQLPFPAGVAWQAGAPHEGFAALDFGPSGGAGRTVVAAAAGTVYVVTCTGGGSYLGVDHGQGWRSTYYHLVNEARGLVGQYVQAGTRLGDAGQALPCGGSSTFNHVHFKIYKDGVAQSANGLSIGGYTAHSSGSDYYGYWTRNSDGARVVTNNGGAACCITSTTSPLTPPESVAPVVIRQGAILSAKAGLGDAWTTLGDLGGDQLQVAGTRIVASSGGTLWGKDGINGTWLRLADGVQDYAISSSLVVIRQGTVLSAKAGLGDAWTTLGDLGGDRLQVAGTRIVSWTAGTLWGKDGINGTWLRLADGVEDFSVSSSVVVIRQGAILSAKAGLGDAWTTLGDLGGDQLQVEGTRIVSSAGGTLWGKDGINGTWLRLADGVQDYAISSSLVVIRQGAVLSAKAGLGDAWTTLGDLGGDHLQVSGTRIVASSGGTVWGKDGINGTWVRLADGVSDYAVQSMRPNLASAGVTRQAPSGYFVGAPITHSFTVRNVGDRQAVLAALILAVRTPTGTNADRVCGTRIVINPGKSRTCTVTVNAAEPGSYSTWIDWADQAGAWHSGALGATSAFTLSSPPPPSAPRSVAARASDRAAVVTWLAPTALNGTNEYRVATTSGTQVCRTTTLTCTVTGLRNGSRYSFTVRAVNAVGPGPSSAPSAGVVPASAPGLVRAVKVIYRKAGKARITWTAPASSGGLAVTRYQVRRRAASASAWGPWVSTALTRAKTLKGLVRGRVYVVQIRAVNPVGAAAPVARRIRSPR